MSLLDGRPVTEIIAQQFAPTAGFGSQRAVIAAIGGIGLGTLAALDLPLSGLHGCCSTYR